MSQKIIMGGGSQKPSSLAGHGQKPEQNNAYSDIPEVSSSQGVAKLNDELRRLSANAEMPAPVLTKEQIYHKSPIGGNTDDYNGFSGSPIYFSGYSGAKGDSGYSGYSGQVGLSGYSGFSGFSGYSGFSGFSGFSGLSGWSGFSGISGYSGQSGFSGFSGYSGLNGGEAVSGYSGASGFSGFSGYSGQNGSASASGWSGYSGQNGTSGFSGFSGTNGTSGYSGINGTSGFSGMSGFSGYSGYSGFSGYSGWSGYSGYSGYSGFSGYSGYSGWSGYSGFSGNSGYSGYSGKSGYSGYSGWSGQQGFQGNQGYSGYSGYSGAAASLLYWNESFHNTGVNATIKATRWYPKDAGSDAVVQPTGAYGSFLLQVPDGTSAGGNKRGQNAVDLQMARQDASYVAGGNFSALLGGENNAIDTTAYDSVISGGRNNRVTAPLGIIMGGEQAKTRSYGQIAKGVVKQEPGDVQSSHYVLMGSLTAGSYSELYLDGSYATKEIVLPDQLYYTWYLRYKGLAKSGGYYAGWGGVVINRTYGDDYCPNELIVERHGAAPPQIATSGDSADISPYIWSDNDHAKNWRLSFEITPYPYKLKITMLADMAAFGALWLETMEINLVAGSPAG